MKKWKCFLLVVLAFTLCLSPITTEAASKDVTSSMKKNKYIKKISRDISSYTSGEMASARSKNKKTEKLRGYNILSISAFVGCRNGKYQYSKKEIQSLSYNLFGIKPSTSSIPRITSPKRKYIAKVEGYTSKTFIYSGGSWGNYVPKYTITKINKVGKNEYDIIITNKLQCLNYSMNYDKTQEIGTTKVRVKKNSKSSYKYKIIDLSYKGNGIGFF